MRKYLLIGIFIFFPVFIWCFFIYLFDGYDLGNVYAQEESITEDHTTDEPFLIPEYKEYQDKTDNEPEVVETESDIPVFEDNNLRFVYREEPYLITSKIIIQSHQTLFVDPGVQLFFDGGSFIVNGNARLIGTQEKPIIIKGNIHQFQSLFWIDEPRAYSVFEHVIFDSYSNGIYLSNNAELHILTSTSTQGYTFLSSNSAKSIIESLAVHHVILPFEVFGNSNIAFTKTSITDFDVGVSLFNDATALFDDVTIQHGDMTALAVFGSSFTTLINSHIGHSEHCVHIFGSASISIKNSKVFKCDQTGIMLTGDDGEFSEVSITKSEIKDSEEGFLISSDHRVIVKDSSILNNKKAVVVSLPHKSIYYDFRNNWWGTEVGPFLSSMEIPQSNSIIDYAMESRVLYEPWHKSMYEVKEEPLITPIIIVPGIMGTQLIDKTTNDEVWPNIVRMMSSISDDHLDVLKMKEGGISINSIKVGSVIESIALNDIFSSLILFLESYSYKKDKSLFLFPYDWRMSVDYNGGLLKSFISSIVEQQNVERVIVIAHSMGGLVTQSALSQGSDHHVSKVFFIGTPHQGSPKSYKALLFGDDMGISINGLSFLSPKKIQDITTYMPSVYNLLPTASYTYSYPILYSKGEKMLTAISYKGSMEIIENMKSKALFETSKQHQNKLNDYRTQRSITFGPTWINIVGCGKTKTIGAIIREDPSWIRKVLSREPRISIKYIQGDGTVPLVSAQGVSAEYSYAIKDVTHSTLPSSEKSISIIASYLGYNASTSPKKIEVDECNLSGITLGIHSPVTGEIVGEDNQPLVDNSIQYDEIEHEKFMFLPDGKSYRIKGVGKEKGTFSITLDKSEIDDSISTSLIFEDIPVSGVAMSYYIDIDSSKTLSQHILYVDQDGDSIYEETYTPHIHTIEKQDQSYKKKNRVLNNIFTPLLTLTQTSHNRYEDNNEKVQRLDFRHYVLPDYNQKHTNNYDQKKDSMHIRDGNSKQIENSLNKTDNSKQLENSDNISYTHNIMTRINIITGLIALIGVLLALALFFRFSNSSSSNLPEKINTEYSPQSDIVGLYKAVRTQGGEENLEDEIDIKSDNTFIWKSEYVSTKKPALYEGNWLFESQQLKLTINKTDGNNMEQPLMYLFELTSDGIKNIEEEYILTKIN